MGRRILVTGGRDNYDWQTIDPAICRNVVDGDTLVHGDAAGVDRMAAQSFRYLKGLTLYIEPHPADWKKYGPAAGGIRNQEMLDSGIDLALFFRGGKGTHDMISRVKKAGIPYRDYTGDVYLR